MILKVTQIQRKTLSNLLFDVSQKLEMCVEKEEPLEIISHRKSDRK